jgi:N-acetylgalactosamine-N,N'-diacetylbacillosaminyl-diphospho-undecaprenol 4-alpha-N-acetylgalactosaminyltransferase
VKSPTSKYKICIVSDHLSGGGAERCSALLSLFFEQKNCEVHHVIVQDKIEYAYAGNVLNLGKLKKDPISIWDRVHRFFVLFTFLRKNTFDFIIDTRVKNRQWQEFFIFKFIYNTSTLIIVHSYMTELYFPNSKILARTIFSKCASIISVSNEIKNKIQEQYGYKSVYTIYNPIDLKAIAIESLKEIESPSNYILAVGNMHVAVKQIDHLLECYKNSMFPQQNIKLLLIGEGILRQHYEKMSSDLHLEDHVLFMGHVENPFPYYKNAIFTILTSKNEGFPTVLLESLACGTPVISYDCFSGPNEIIKDKHNGLLVENQNKIKLTEAMNTMITNKELYLHCKTNAKISVESFALEHIGSKWLDLFKTIKHEHKNY